MTHIFSLTHKLFFSIKVECFSWYFPYYGLLDLTQSINSYSGLKCFMALYCTKQSHMIQKIHKNSTNTYFLLTYGKDNELSCVPSISTCSVEAQELQTSWEQGSKLPGAPHKIFFPLQPFKRDLLRICSAVWHVQYGMCSTDTTVESKNHLHVQAL